MSLDTFVPQIDAADRSEGLNNFVESRRQNFREVRLALEKRHQGKVKSRQKTNNRMTMESAWAVAHTDDLVLVKESSSNTYRNGRGDKLEHERWTGPWKVNNFLNAGLIIKVAMKGRSTQTRHISSEGIKPFHARPPDLAVSLPTSSPNLRSTNFGLSTPSVAVKPLDTLCDRHNVTSATRVPNWEYRGRYENGKKPIDYRSMFSIQSGICTSPVCPE